MKGFLPDMIKLMQDTCDDVEVEWTHTEWGKCFEESSGSWVGDDIKYGGLHACAGYTKTKGTRARLFEFADAITTPNARTGGIITRLVNGVPVVSPSSNLTGVKVVDVKGWAPTQDNLQIARNSCDGDKPFDYGNIVFVDPGASGNKAAMAALKSGAADAMWVYSDQGYTCSNALDTDDCSNWGGLGTEFAYIHTGMSFAFDGTTMAIAKRGSGIGKLLNPCIQKAMATEKFKELCTTFNKIEECYPNSHFGTPGTIEHYNKLQAAKTGAEVKACTDGYCPCA
jgi:hypothetical protein